jgi:hypothetical protein
MEHKPTLGAEVAGVTLSTARRTIMKRLTLDDEMTSYDEVDKPKKQDENPDDFEDGEIIVTEDM